MRDARGVCPGCGQGSSRVHSRYQRGLADAPFGARTVVIGLRVRRFFCENTGCVRRTFVEQVPGLTSKHARRTELLRGLLVAIGLALAGRAGSRLATALGMPAGRDALLRLVRALPDPPVGEVRVLGVDDFAIRRGASYGTVLLDIDSHRPVDLVEERTADVFADWLAAHPGVEVICRDRSGAYAEGARTGAPDAIQVADRYHLWANLGEAVQRTVLAHRACLAEPTDQPHHAQPSDTAGDEPVDEPHDDTAPPEHGAPSRLEVRTRERHAAVAELRAKGYLLNAICREMGLCFRTVQRFAQASGAEELLAAHRARSHKLDRFTPYVHQRWNAGVTDASALHAELVELGWTGGLRTVQRYLARSATPTGAHARPRPPRRRRPLHGGSPAGS